MWSHGLNLQVNQSFIKNDQYLFERVIYHLYTTTVAHKTRPLVWVTSSQHLKQFAWVLASYKSVFFRTHTC